MAKDAKKKFVPFRMKGKGEDKSDKGAEKKSDKKTKETRKKKMK